MPSSTAGPQTAVGHASSVPSLSCLFHCGVYIGWSRTVFFATRPFQKSATRFVAASVIPTFHVSPSFAHHLPPACWERPANQPGSCEENVVRYRLGSFARSCCAVWANSAHVVGTFRPKRLKRSWR